MIRHASLHAALSDAVGDDPALLAELRGAFLQAAAAQVARMAGEAGAWGDAAARLHGLAASFGADGLMTLAGEALEARDRVGMLRRLRVMLRGLEA